MAIKAKHWVELDVKKLVKADWNYKTEDEDKAEKLRANIKRNGQIENIIVRELPTGFFEVVNGNHRYDAFVQLGMKKVICFNMGKISDASARRIAIETNETKFDRDNVKLASVIKEIALDEGAEFNVDELKLTMPFDESELKGFGELLEFDWNQFEPKDEPPEPKNNDKDKTKECTCPGCGLKFEPK
jgi:ParB-like chromosome segregation protein Spo0J